MKKIISFAACATALFMASCGSGDYLEKKELLTKGDSSTLDTLSYVIGMNIGNQIVNGIMPQLKADYDALVGTIE
jgi:surfactin synthase thioesterase subunit